MSQNLPIQGPQVMEIQGGVRLTPLGLSQLEAEANGVGLPGGAPPVLAAPADTATTVAVPRGAATPGTYVIDVPTITNSESGSFSMEVGINGITTGFLVTGITFIKQGGAGHGSGTNTIQVKNGATALSDLSSFTSQADGTITAAATIDDAQAYVASGGSLVIHVVKGAGGNAAHRVIINGILA